MHALIRDGQIIETRNLRETWFDGSRWWDFSENGHDPADHGWLPLVYVDRPADTATTTWERDEPRLVNGVPTVGWVERDKTPEELAAEAQAATAQTLTADTRADEARIESAIEDLRIVLADNSTAGSLRQVRGTVTNSYSAAVMRALIDVLISWAQADRRVARQLLRVQRLATNDFDSADVGAE